MNGNANIVIIYTLEDPRTGQVRYVGKTGGDLMGRLKGHLEDRSETHKIHWIRQLAAIGLKPTIDVIETMFNPSEIEWQEAERFWISSLRFCGCKLTNLAAGGEGGSHCLESREKMSAWQRGRKLTPQHIENMRIASTGRKHSDEVKFKIGKGWRGKKMPAAMVEKLRQSNLGRKHTEETRMKDSLAGIGRKRTREDIEKQVASYKATIAIYGRKPNSKESCRKISIANTGKRHTAETLAKMSEARRQWYVRATPEQKEARISRQRATVMSKKQALEGCLTNN